MDATVILSQKAEVKFKNKSILLSDIESRMHENGIQPLQHHSSVQTNQFSTVRQNSAGYEKSKSMEGLLPVIPERIESKLTSHLTFFTANTSSKKRVDSLIGDLKNGSTS